MKATRIETPGFLSGQRFGSWLFVLMMLLPGMVLYPQTSLPEMVKILVTGTVVDQSGAPLPGASIQVLDLEGRQIAASRTNSRGEFLFELVSGNYVLSASLAGFSPLEQFPLQVPPALPPKLILQIPSLRQEIVVTATKTETPLSQIGSSVTVVTGRQLSDEGISTVAEALRRVAGLTLVQGGGTGQVTSLFIRGGGSNYTKVLIDGIPVNEPGGNYNFAYLSTTGIDRIEVVRGSQSALFGSDAIAGVIQIFTRHGEKEGLSPKPSATIEGGSFDTIRYAGGIQGKGERLDYAAYFSRMDTDNNVPNGSFNEETITGNLGFRLGRKADIRAVFRDDSGRTGVPGQWAFARPDLDSYYRRRDLAGSLGFTYRAGPSWTQRLSYVASHSRQFSADPIDSGSYTPHYGSIEAPFPLFDFTYQTLNQTLRQKLSYQSDFMIPFGQVLTAGADYERESGLVGDPQLNPLHARRDNFGGYFQDQLALHNRLFAVTGIRLERNASFGFFAAPRLSVAFHVHQPSQSGSWGLTKLKANFGLGIKEPSLVESYSDSPYFRGNPDLQPEKSVSFDAGVVQQIGHGHGTLEISYFENHFRDQIGYQITDYSTFAGSFFNVGRTRARGVETTLQLQLDSNWEIAGSYTFIASRVLESTDATDPAYAKGQELFRRPRHSGNLDVRWTAGRWTLGATGIFMGSRVDSDFVNLGITRNKGYGILNLLASFRLGGDSSLFLAVNNTLNKRYMEVLGYPALGASFRLGIRAGF